MECPGNKDVGGMNIYVLEVARRLGALGYIVDIFTHAVWSYEDFTPYRNVHIVNLHSLPIYVDRNDILKYASDLTDEISNFMVDGGFVYDIIHSNYWVSAYVGDLLAKRFSIPHIVMFHTLGAVKESFPFVRKEPDMRTKVEKDLMNNVQCVIIPDSNELGFMKQYYGYDKTNYAVIPCGVDLDQFYPINRKIAKQYVGFEDNDRVILCVGRPDPMKGYDLAIRALAVSKSKARMLFLCGTGNTEPVYELEKLANECHVSERVTFKTDVGHNELLHYYCASDMLLNSSYYASFSHVILEALACGTPVVSTNTGIAPEVIQNGINGVLTETSSKDIAKGIDQLYKKIGSRRFNKTSLVKAIEMYSWNVVTDLILNIYQKFCD
jgi:D-inositol-3-phosphate glycosyltransferase